MDLKKPLTFDEQLDKLIAHGMIVADREKAKDILNLVKYISEKVYEKFGKKIELEVQVIGED